MDWANDRELLVDLISYASIVSAAIFGMIGLFTDYKKDGKTTRWGHLAAGGIGLSAMLAMTSAVLQKQISSDERAAGERRAREQRALEKAQFNTQIGQLLSLNRHMAGVNRANATLMTDMRRSLGAQQVQLASARRNLLLTAGLRSQEQANTFRLLRTMWQDANRVPVDGVTLLVDLRCHLRGDDAIPRILGDEAAAEITIAPLASASRVIPHFELFSAISLIGQQQEIEDEVSQISSMDHQVVAQDLSESSGPPAGYASQLVRFTTFTTHGAWRHAEPDSWREAAIEVLISNENPRWADELAGRLVDLAHPDSEKARPFFTLEGRFRVPDSLHGPDGSQILPLPCDVGGRIMVNGRLAAETSGMLVRVVNPPLPTRLLLRFYIVRSDPLLFPLFAAASEN